MIEKSLRIKIENIYKKGNFVDSKYISFTDLKLAVAIEILMDVLIDKLYPPNVSIDYSDDETFLITNEIDNYKIQLTAYVKDFYKDIRMKSYEQWNRNFRELLQLPTGPGNKLEEECNKKIEGLGYILQELSIEEPKGKDKEI